MERYYSLYKTIEYITRDTLVDIIWFGVWRGGRSILGALTLIKNQQTYRKVYFYDT